MRKNFLKLLAAALIVYLGAVAWIYINQRSLMYFPDQDIKDISEYNLGDAEDITLTSVNGNKIQLWYHAPTKPNMPMVLYFHGNSYNLGQRSLKFRELLDMGYGFISPSYQGFGKSEGTPSREAILGDAKTAVKFLEEKGYKTEDSIVIGESLGSGVAINIAKDHVFKGVFLITPYTAISDRAQEIYWYFPVKYLVKDEIVSKDLIGQIHQPIIMVHGTNDLVIPHSHSEKLYELANDPKKLIIYDGKGHSNLDTREIFNAMTEFLMIDKIEQNANNTK